MMQKLRMSSILSYKCREKPGKESSKYFYPFQILCKQIGFCYGNQTTFNECIERHFLFFKT